MKVISAGMTIDREYIERAKRGEIGPDDILTPETISAAYARISRFADSATELRAKARAEVEQARGSNQTIVYGMGHHSVAEHVLLNFDILGLSRRAIEDLEEKRLCAYTEKSQRYQKVGPGEYLLPKEFTGENGVLFDNINELQTELYNKSLKPLKEFHQARNPEKMETKKGRKDVAGYAKEDARYALNMATLGQLGFSANARNLEKTIRDLRHSPLAETRELSRQLCEVGIEVAPSLIILSDPVEFAKAFPDQEPVSDDFIKDHRATLQELADGIMSSYRPASEQNGIATDGDVTLLDHTSEPDSKIIAALLHSSSDPSLPYHQCLNIAQQMGITGREDFVKSLLEKKTKFDAVPREFEYSTFLIEAEVSSSEFAQWKRHRMMTITKQPYDPDLGYTFPESVIETGLKGEFNDMFDRTSEAFYHLVDTHPEAAEYILTNGHRRRFLINANLRQLYAIAALRMDEHAQWEIRNTAGEMMSLVSDAAPATAMLATGKHLFNDLHDELYGED
ncbi:FAD-dependent thymidylate synthase [Thermoproteota archaeon]